MPGLLSLDSDDDEDDDEEGGISSPVRCAKCDLYHLLFANMAMCVDTMSFAHPLATPPHASATAAAAAAAQEVPSPPAQIAWKETPHPDDPESRENLLTLFQRCKAQVQQYIEHVVRAVSEKSQFNDLLESLQPHQMLVIVDWKMKILELIQREGQEEFFGKSGNCLQGFCLIRRRYKKRPSSVRPFLTPHLVLPDPIRAS